MSASTTDALLEPDRSDDPPAERAGFGDDDERTESNQSSPGVDAGSDDADRRRATHAAESAGDDAIPREKLERVVTRIRFLRRVFEREAEAGDGHSPVHSQLAVVKEIESEVERVLDD